VIRTSLVIPVYNGGHFIEGTLDTARSYLERRGEQFEIIVVDDGSNDGSSEILARATVDHGAMQLLTHPVNGGKGSAVRSGILKARGDRVIFTDADLAYPLTEVDKIIAALDSGADVAIANRVDPDSLYHMSPAFFSYLYTRHVLSRVFNLAARTLIGVGVSDCQAGLKGFRRETAEAIFRRQRLDGFTFDVEVLFIARRLGLKIREVPVEFHYLSEPSTVEFARDGLCAIRDLIDIRRNATRGLYDS
jgi:dolichyl-phosphate beta-glucosyltransferase